MLKRIEEGAYVPSIEQRVAGLDEPLNNLSSNHAEQDRDREEQPFRLRIPRVRLFPLGRVRLLILLLVRLHAPSYTKRNTKSPGQRGVLTGLFTMGASRRSWQP
jgi:hypothetical protein